MADPKKTTIKKTNEYLKYTFSEAEQQENAKLLARKNQQAVELELKKKQMMADIKSDTDAVAADVAKLARWVNDGYDYRGIDCEVRFHNPKEGMKQIVRLDTGEVVSEKKMDQFEMQEALPFEEDKKADTKKAGK